MLIPTVKKKSHTEKAQKKSNFFYISKEKQETIKGKRTTPPHRPLIPIVIPQVIFSNNMAENSNFK